MKTISKCFLYIAVMCPLLLADFYFAFYGIAEGNWIVATINIFAMVLSVFAIRSVYKTAKGYEETLCNTVHDLQLHNALRELADFCESRAKERKDKEDEVEADK